MSPLPDTYWLTVKRGPNGKISGVVVTQPEGEFEFRLAGEVTRPAISVNELHQKVVDAMGGEANWRKITTRIIDSDIDFENQGVRATNRTWAAASNKTASETTMTALGKTIATGWDYFDGTNGEESYSFAPLEKFSGKRLDDARLNADSSRLQNAPSWHYVHKDQWRYEKAFTDYHTVPQNAGPDSTAQGHTMDMQVRAVRQGWLPFYPQFPQNPIELVKEARVAGATSTEEVIAWIVDRLKKKEMKFSVEDPDAEENWPRVWFIWRGNALMASAKGHEYFLRHYLGTHDNAVGEDLAEGSVKEVAWHEHAPQGKMDLVVDLNFRMDTSALYSHIILPAAVVRKS